MKILVTGVTGLLGNLIVRRLLAEKHQVRALLRDSRKAAQVRELGAEIIFGDLEHGESLKKVTPDVDIAIHCAGLVGTGRSSTEDYFRINTEGTRLLLDASKAAGVKRFVFMSTTGVYGLNTLRPNIDESTPRRSSGTGYTDSKIEAEKLVETSGIDYTILRPYWITGGGDRFLIPQVARLLKSGEFRYIGDGQQMWSLSVVENIADAVATAALHPAAANKIYNVADTTVRISETIETIAQALKVPAPTKKTSVVGAIFRSLLDQSEKNPARMGIDLFFPLWRGVTISSERIRAEVGWQPHIPWKDSLTQGVLDWQKHNS